MNNKEQRKSPINLSDALSVIEEKLKMGGTVTFKPKGTSMLPMLRPGKDSVTIKREDRISKNDVVLYKRKNNQFVLHRIVRKTKDKYVMRGDNQWFFERGVSREMIIGVMTEFMRKERRISRKNIAYKAYIMFSKVFWLYLLIKSVFFRVIKKIKNK